MLSINEYITEQIKTKDNKKDNTDIKIIVKKSVIKQHKPDDTSRSIRG